MSVEVRCTGCGERLPLPSVKAPLQTQELLESLQKSPPFCVVCSCRTVAGPRPGIEVWEPIDESRGEEPETQVAKTETALEIHDNTVGYTY